MLKALPVGCYIFVSSADEVDVAMLKGHREWVIHAAHNLDRIVKLPHLFRRRTVDNDHDLAGCAVRSPEPVVVVTADRWGQAVAEKY